MTSENIQSAKQVLSSFLDEQSKDPQLDQNCIETIIKLRDEGKLSRTSLLRQMEEARKALIKNDAHLNEA